MNTKTKSDLTIEKKRNTNSFENINLTKIYKMSVWEKVTFYLTTALKIIK